MITSRKRDSAMQQSHTDREQRGKSETNQRGNRPALVILSTLVILSGCLATLFWPQIQGTLTLRTHMAPRSKSATARGTGGANQNTRSILVQDTFHRSAQRLWGRASDGYRWEVDTSQSEAFTIARDEGQIAWSARAAYSAIIGPPVESADVTAIGSLSRFQHTSFGVLLRWTGTDSWYKAAINGFTLSISKKAGGRAVRLAMCAFVAKAAVLYTIRFQAEGPTLRASVWRTGTSASATWMVATTDTTLHAGYGGVYVLINRKTIASVTTFIESGDLLVIGTALQRSNER